MYASNIGSIGTVRKFSPVRRASSAASPLEWSEEYFDGIEIAVHVLRAQRVARDGGDERRVDAAGEPDQHRAETVLRGVRAQAHDQCRVDLLVVVEPLRVAAGQLRLVRRDGLVGEDHVVDPQTVVDHPGRRLGRGGRQVQVENDAALGELRGPGDHLAVRVDDDRVAVEDQLVLAADHRQVGGGAAGLLGPLADQVQPGVVLVPLVRRGVDREQQPGPGGAGGRHAAAVLPEVLADRERHIDTVDPHDGHRVARHEVPELVEDAVVGQVVLGEASGRPGRGAAPRRRSAAPRRAGRSAAGPSRSGRGSRRRPAARRSPRVETRGERAQRARGTPRRRTAAGPGPRRGNRSAPSRGTPPGGRPVRRSAGSSGRSPRRCRRGHRRSSRSDSVRGVVEARGSV